LEYSPRIVEAFAFTYELHRAQIRKGSHVPYITHLMGVAAIVGRHGGDEEQFIAALLHDAVEDQGGIETLELIRQKFGDKVAEYVSGCTDSDTTPKPPWEERKEKFIQSTRTASPRQKLIVAADKLHNAKSIISDLGERGNAVWKMFKGGRENTLWYYGEMVLALSHNWSHALLRELADAVDLLHRRAADLEKEETARGI
jgi:(p)ppGpp synthase/HD superfamily hydrolase